MKLLAYTAIAIGAGIVIGLLVPETKNGTNLILGYLYAILLAVLNIKKD